MNDTYQIVVLGWWAEEQRRIAFVRLLQRELGLGLADAKSTLDASLSSEGGLLTIAVAADRALTLALEIERLGAECRVIGCADAFTWTKAHGALRRQIDVGLRAASTTAEARAAVARVAPEMSAAALRFADEAFRFCRFVEAADESEVERLRQAATRLSLLYAAALDLPDVEPGAESEPGAVAGPPKAWAGFGEFEYYWEIFDPYSNNDAVTGSLSDDLLDVYMALKRGLHLWRPGEASCTDAVWEWKFAFESHWGDHAVDALRAIHRALQRKQR